MSSSPLPLLFGNVAGAAYTGNPSAGQSCGQLPGTVASEPSAGAQFTSVLSLPATVPVAADYHPPAVVQPAMPTSNWRTLTSSVVPVGGQPAVLPVMKTAQPGHLPAGERGRHL